MKTTVLAIALAFATMPLTFAAQNPPAKTDSTAKPADKTSKPKVHKDTAKKPAKTSSKTPAAVATPAPVAKTAAPTPVKQ